MVLKKERAHDLMLFFFKILLIQYAHTILNYTRCSVAVSISNFESHVPDSTLIESLRFRQEGHSELKCYNALIKS